MQITTCRRFYAALVALLAFVAPTSSLMAQISIQQITGNAVQGNLDRYKELGDAVVLFQRGNGPAALKLFQEIHKKFPELPPGEVMFAHLCFASNNPKPGLVALQSAAVSHPDDPESWNMMADLQLRQGHLAEAEVIFDKARSIAAAFAGTKVRKQLQLRNALAGLARAQELRGLWKAAESYLLEWKSIDDKNPDVYRRLATAQLNLEKYAEARSTLITLREIDPNQLPADVTLGTIYESIGKSEEAQKLMQTALKNHAEDFGSRIAIARWALNKGDLNAARESAQYAAKLDEKSHLPQLIVATADLKEGKVAEAEEQFRSIYALKPGDFDAINGLATALLSQTVTEKLQQGLELAKVNARTQNNIRSVEGRQAVALLAWGLFQNGSTQEADQLIQSVVVSGEITPEIGYYASRIFMETEKQDLAKQLLEKSLDNTSKFANRKDAEKLLEKMSKPE